MGRVLVADDDADLLESVVAVLTEAGSEVVTATTGADLLARLAEDVEFDLVITDVSMPWITGLQVAKSLREAGIDVPVLIITGHDDQALSSRVMSLGDGVHLLRKPFDSARLRATVEAMAPGCLAGPATGTPPNGPALGSR